MPLSVDDFLRNVLRSELLDREQLRSALRHLPADKRDQVAAVADYLVAQHRLTAFQANKLVSGVVAGLKLGPYFIQTPIGRGGMGTVYLAKDGRNDEMVAIKVVSPQRAREGERHLARFQREMMLSQKLKHPNVALTKEVGEFRGVHYLVLEFIPGVTLHRLVSKEGPLAIPRAARLFGEVCAALEHAHEQGLVHRDLKPTNIMVTPEDHAKLLDLGLAFMIGEEVDDPEVVGGKGYVVGSVEYISPEQTRDSTQVDGRSDLYSLGCTLYFALSGRGPFSFGSNKDKVIAHRRQEPEPIRQRRPEVPEGLALLVHRLLAKKPEMRPTSAAQVRQELAQWSETAAPASRPTETAVQFEVVGAEYTFEEHDTLSEVFKLTEAEANEATFTPANVGGLFEMDRELRMLLWVGVGAVSVIILILVLIVILRMAA